MRGNFFITTPRTNRKSPSGRQRTLMYFFVCLELHFGYFQIRWRRCWLSVGLKPFEKLRHTPRANLALIAYPPLPPPEVRVDIQNRRCCKTMVWCASISSDIGSVKTYPDDALDLYSPVKKTRANMAAYLRRNVFLKKVCTSYTIKLEQLNYAMTF